MSKLSTILNVRGVFGVRKKLYAAAAILAAVSGTVAAVSYYGQYTGQFVVSVDTDLQQRGIMLTDTTTTDYRTPRLKTDGISDVDPITEDDVDYRTARATEGYFKDPKGQDYFSYTFYLRNVGEITTNVLVTMSVEGYIGNGINASRIWFFSGDDADDIGVVYKTAEDDPDDEILSKDAIPDDGPVPINYLSDTVVFVNEIEKFTPDEYMKYTFIVWIEGWDPDTTDEGFKDIRGTSVQFRLDFEIPSIADELEVENDSSVSNFVDSVYTTKLSAGQSNEFTDVITLREDEKKADKKPLFDNCLIRGEENV